MKCNSEVIRGCSKVSKHNRKKYMTMTEIVSFYRTTYFQSAENEKAWFADCPSIKAAIRKAISSELNNSSKLMSSHQRRIGRKRLKAVTHHYVNKAEKYRLAKSFDEVMKITESVILPKGARIGELARYDFSERIGAFLNLEPQDIYLHSGTRIGARRLGYKEKSQISYSVIVSDHSELKGLAARHIENLLCIFKNNLTPSE